MILLQDIEDYFNGRCGADKLIKKVFYFTEEGELGDVKNDIAPEHQPFLMVIVPSFDSEGSLPDRYSENVAFLIYLLEKEDSSDKTTFEIQKELQPIIEALKGRIRDDAETCHWLNGLNFGSFHTDPERQKFANFTGWSVSFDVEV